MPTKNKTKSQVKVSGQQMAIIAFKPKKVTKDLLSVLSDKARDIIIARYGLGTTVKKETLELIGKKYGITRERVRQIENHSLEYIRRSEVTLKNSNIFDEIKDVIKKLGGMVSEKDLLNSISNKSDIQNHIHFLLVIGDYFIKRREDQDFHHRWHIDEDLSGQIHISLQNLYQSLSDDDLISEPDMIKLFLEDLKGVSEEYRQDEIVRRWLSLSKKLGKNPLGEWGKSQSPNVKAKGIRDYAFLIMRKHGTPIHFRDIAKSIEKVFNKKAHVATTHNELIKDPRFILVGRGLYALNEWGFSGGVVKDVIRDVLLEHGPLTKKEIIEIVLKKRFVKENTVLVNLQNPAYFRKDKQGKYSVVQ